MTKHEFSRVFKEFESNYSQPYPEAQAQAIWDAVGDIAPGQFASALGGLTEKHQRPPAVGVIKDACRNFIYEAKKRSQEAIIKERKAQGKDCAYCHNTGLLSAKMKERPQDHPYAFVCTICDLSNSLRFSQTIPRWSKTLDQTFDVCL